MNNSVYHLIIFLASLIFLAVIIITGHDTSPLVTNLIGGSVGGSGATLLASFFRGPQDPTATAPVARQGGFTTLRFLAFLLTAAFTVALSACASLGTAPASTGNAQTVATTCAGAAAAVKSLTVVKQAGYLTAPDVSAVNSALAVVNPVCNGLLQPTYTNAVVLGLTGAVAQLATLEAKYHAAGTGP